MFEKRQKKKKMSLSPCGTLFTLKSLYSNRFDCVSVLRSRNTSIWINILEKYKQPGDAVVWLCKRDAAIEYGANSCFDCTMAMMIIVMKNDNNNKSTQLKC